MVSIIIVNYNGKEQTSACLQSLRAVSSAIAYEVILVDNYSTDGSVEIIRRDFPDITVLEQKTNVGFGQANNIGAHSARGEYLFFINNDTLFQRDILKPLKEFIETDEYTGAAAPMLLNPDGTYQLSFGYFPSIINELRTKRDTARLKNIPADRSPKRVDWVSFAAVMIRRSAFIKVNGFDERYFMYFEDADLCLRLQKTGYRTFYCPEYALIHRGGGSWSKDVSNTIRKEYRRSQMLFYTSHRSPCETLLLRIYLIFQFMVMYVFTRGGQRRHARSVIKMVISFHANRS